MNYFCKVITTNMANIQISYLEKQILAKDPLIIQTFEILKEHAEDKFEISSDSDIKVVLRAYQSYFEENTKLLTGELDEAANELITDLAQFIPIPKMRLLFKDSFFVDLFKKLKEAKIEPSVLVDIITAKSEEVNSWSVYTYFRVNEIFRNLIKVDPNKMCSTTLDYIKYIYEKMQSISSNTIPNEFSKLYNKLKYSVENKELLEKTMRDPEVCLVLSELNQKGLGPEQVIAALSLHDTIRKSETINIEENIEKDFITPLTSGNSKALAFNLKNEIIKNSLQGDQITPQNYNFYENESLNFGQSTKNQIHHRGNENWPSTMYHTLASDVNPTPPLKIDGGGINQNSRPFTYQDTQQPQNLVNNVNNYENPLYSKNTGMEPDPSSKEIMS